jgi:hypothetical protein
MDKDCVMHKCKVLLNWDTTRKDLLEPFLNLKDDIEFVVIWGNIKQTDEWLKPFKQVFFEDYTTPYALLQDVKPDKVLFLGIDSFPQVALNLAAKNQGIPTYIMHHGIYHSDNLENNRQLEKLGLHKKRKPLSNISSLIFYFSALRLKNVGQILKYTYFAWLRQRRNAYVAKAKCVFDARVPDHYIDLSPHNAIITKKIDRISGDEKFTYIGHPFFDQTLQRLDELSRKNHTINDNYFLLIDFPNRDDVLALKIMTVTGKHRFYKELSDLAKSRNCRLKIKLHPSAYNSSYNYQDDNIDLIRETDIANLIYGAKECFSFFSTLLIPVIHQKKHCYIFSTGKEYQLQRELIELGCVSKLETENFTSSKLLENKPNGFKPGCKTFIARYLYFTDGRSTERLKNILLSEAS